MQLPVLSVFTPNAGVAMSTHITDYQPDDEIVFPKHLRFHPTLSFGEKMFYAEIQSLQKKSKKKTCEYCSRKLSRLFGVSHPTILKWIRNLTQLKLIEIGIDFTNTEHRHFLKTKSMNTQAK
jgi:hypothetical protein